MHNRIIGVLVAIVALAGLAVVGALGGGFLASLNEADPVGFTPTATAGPTRAPAPAPTMAPTLAPTPSPARTSTGSDRVVSTAPASPEETRRPAGGTYRLDRVIHAQASTSVKLLTAEVTGDRMRLNTVYRNASASPWWLKCPTLDMDLASLHITLADGQIVRPERTWCAARAGESFALEPGQQVSSWAVFAVVPEIGSSFALSWYNFPVAYGLRLG
ncbi:hypothetical protein [Micromonospora sp. DT233]|uniref:hypothetical protein n=1 Tax=Micromonospora sp. DT233 TaxID=3393432 RepID=UPI003CF98025